MSYFDEAPVYPSHVGRGVGNLAPRTKEPDMGEYEKCVLFRAGQDSPYFAYPAGREGDGVVRFPGINEPMLIAWKRDDRQNLYADYHPFAGLYCRIYPGSNDHLERWVTRPETVTTWGEAPNTETPVEYWVRWIIQPDNRIIGSAFPMQNAGSVTLPEIFETKTKTTTSRMIGGEYVLITPGTVVPEFLVENGRLCIVLPIPTN